MKKLDIISTNIRVDSLSWLYSLLLALVPANSSVGRASDCSSEGRRFEPGLVDIETSLTQLVECQLHELKVVGSIPIRGTSCLTQCSYDSIFVYMEALTVVVVNFYVSGMIDFHF